MENNEELTGLYVLLMAPLGLVSAACAIMFLQLHENAFAAISFAVAIVTVAMILRRCIRYVGEIRRRAASAEKIERIRAEQAETHVEQLQHYVEELERSSRALRESRERFRHAAYHDALTGLPNRSRFLEQTAPHLENAKGDRREPCAVLVLDLDRFKTVNDSLGHSVGDKLIVNVGKRLVAATGDRGVVGRFSGDEFAILLFEITAADEAVHFAETISKQIGAAFELDGRQVFTSVSIGIAIGNPRYQNAEELLRDADIAMYYAKETKKRYVIFDQIMHARAVTLLELETDLRLAVERNEFELFYQPIVNLDNVKLVGFEALVRWNHPNRGLITPGEFISVAESTGLIVPMTTGLLRSACEQVVAWHEKGLAPYDLAVSVNLSAVHLAHRGLVDELRAIIFETGIEAECLKLEITESAVMQNAESMIAVLKKIKELGVRLSIDDFGTGYSSLSYLHRFPIDTLKIDRSFVSTMEDGSENGEIVRTIIALSKALNLSVIAEGIESIHQFHQLRILGCEYGQGYLFSRPVSATDAENLLADNNRWRNILPPNEFGVIARNLEYTHLRIQ